VYPTSSVELNHPPLTVDTGTMRITIKPSKMKTLPDQIPGMQPLSAEEAALNRDAYENETRTIHIRSASY
jgi:hypothetical protein